MSDDSWMEQAAKIVNRRRELEENVRKKAEEYINANPNKTNEQIQAYISKIQGEMNEKLSAFEENEEKVWEEGRSHKALNLPPRPQSHEQSNPRPTITENIRTPDRAVEEAPAVTAKSQNID